MMALNHVLVSGGRPESGQLTTGPSNTFFPLRLRAAVRLVPRIDDRSWSQEMVDSGFELKTSGFQPTAGLRAKMAHEATTNGPQASLGPFGSNSRPVVLSLRPAGEK